ncbi:MAG: exo-alpha-sialidase [Candidatus Latescibacterota bacterium]
MDPYRSMASLASTLELSAPFRREALFQEKDLFVAGLDDVNIFRIPALLATPGDVLLAFCEARERDDNDPTDLVLKRSLPVTRNLQGVNGVCWPNDRRWSPMQVVVPGKGEAILCPCPLIDRTDGKIWMCCRRVEGGLANSLEVAYGALLMLSSADEGATWSAPEDISDQVGYFLPGPGVGTQLRSGRLIVPGYDRHSAKVIFSDDHGRTWRVGQHLNQRGDESQAVELADGILALNMRIAPGCRYVALSRDGGETWFEEHRAEALPDPSCMAAIVRYSDGGVDGRSRLLFANPSSPTNRTQLTVKLSYDEGKTWPVARTIHSGQAAYSSLAVLADGTIGLLYETGDVHPYERIRFARFSLEWLTEGRDRPRPDLLPLELPLEWDFRIDPDDMGLEQGWFAEGTEGPWERIRVDSPWTSQGHAYHGVGWYRLRFTVPDQLGLETRLDVLFGAIHGYARAYVDGVQIAEEKVSPWVMCDRPFFAPLPRTVRPGQTCHIVVRVAKDDGPAGLWKPVCLVERA